MKKIKFIFLVLFTVLLISCEQKNSALRIKTTEGKAFVFIDGKEIGTTPLDVMLSKGEHFIEVTKSISDKSGFVGWYSLVLAENVSKAINIRMYSTIKIGSQMWLSENLNMDDWMEDFLKLNKNDYCTCFGCDYKTEYCEKYGVPYDFEKAIRLSEKIKGWHLPNEKEWDKLINYLGGMKIAGEKLKSKSGWDYFQCNCSNSEQNGSNSSGFNALPAGYDMPIFIKEQAKFWSSSKINEYDVTSYLLYCCDKSVRKSSSQHKLSVRLIRD